MGTNYYYKKTGEHIGKRSAAGKNTTSFTLAIPLKEIDKRKTVINEYGEVFSHREFMKIINSCIRIDTNFEGTFC